MSIAAIARMRYFPGRNPSTALLKQAAMCKVIIAVFITVLISGCKNEEPTQASVPNIAGHWQGQAQDNTGTYTTTLTIIQNGQLISGSFSSTSGLSGTLSGTLNGNSADFTMGSSNTRYCSYHAVETFSGNTATGRYNTINCTVSVTGTLRLTRQ